VFATDCLLAVPGVDPPAAIGSDSRGTTAGRLAGLPGSEGAGERRREARPGLRADESASGASRGRWWDAPRPTAGGGESGRCGEEGYWDGERRSSAPC